jgi:trans-aconitate methyltransferase
VPAPFESRFGRTATAFVTYRPEYPPELFSRILAVVPPDHRRCAMDLGAGTGKSTRALLDHFAEVIAVEPDPLMGEKLRADAPGAIVRVAAAEEVSQAPASVDLIVIAQALHWMDVSRVMANVALWLRPGGVLAVCGGEFPRMPGPVGAVIRQEFAEHWNQFRDERLNLTESSQNVLREAHALRVLDDQRVPHKVDLTAQEFAGFCRSSSFGSAFARTLADPESYWRDLEERFRGAWPEDRIPIDFGPWLVLARKE